MEKCSGRKRFEGKCRQNNGVCGERVVRNFIQCTKFQRWLHRRCSGVPRQVSLLSCRDVFVCRTCLGHSCSAEVELEFKRDEDVLEAVEKFCYLGSMISCLVEHLIQ